MSTGVEDVNGQFQSGSNFAHLDSFLERLSSVIADEEDERRNGGRAHRWTDDEDSGHVGMGAQYVVDTYSGMAFTPAGPVYVDVDTGDVSAPLIIEPPAPPTRTTTRVSRRIGQARWVQRNRARAASLDGVEVTESTHRMRVQMKEAQVIRAAGLSPQQRWNYYFEHHAKAKRPRLTVDADGNVSSLGPALGLAAGGLVLGLYIATDRIRHHLPPFNLIPHTGFLDTLMFPVALKIMNAKMFKHTPFLDKLLLRPANFLVFRPSRRVWHSDFMASVRMQIENEVVPPLSKRWSRAMERTSSRFGLFNRSLGKNSAFTAAILYTLSFFTTEFLHPAVIAGSVVACAAVETGVPDVMNGVARTAAIRLARARAFGEQLGLIGRNFLEPIPWPRDPETGRYYKLRELDKFGEFETDRAMELLVGDSLLGVDSKLDAALAGLRAALRRGTYVVKETGLVVYLTSSDDRGAIGVIEEADGVNEVVEQLNEDRADGEQLPLIDENALRSVSPELVRCKIAADRQEILDKEKALADREAAERRAEQVVAIQRHLTDLFGAPSRLAKLRQAGVRVAAAGALSSVMAGSVLTGWDAGVAAMGLTDTSSPPSVTVQDAVPATPTLHGSTVDQAVADAAKRAAAEAHLNEQRRAMVQTAITSLETSEVTEANPVENVKFMTDLLNGYKAAQVLGDEAALEKLGTAAVWASDQAGATSKQRGEERVLRDMKDASPDYTSKLTVNTDGTGFTLQLG